MIKFDNVTKIYNLNKKDEKVAVKNINFTVNTGETLILKGASGSGKTTLLNILAAISKPNEGAVFVDDLCVSKLPDNFASEYRRSSIGIIFQSFNLLNHLTVFENIIAPLVPEKKSIYKSKNDLKDFFDKFNLNELLNTKVKYLSGGEQQRVAIARALINNPKIIIADEPTAHLDTKLCDELISYFEKFHKEGKTIIIATHDERLLKLKANILTIKDGELC